MTKKNLDNFLKLHKNNETSAQAGCFIALVLCCTFQSEVHSTCVWNCPLCAALMFSAGNNHFFLERTWLATCCPVSIQRGFLLHQGKNSRKCGQNVTHFCQICARVSEIKIRGRLSLFTLSREFQMKGTQLQTAKSWNCRFVPHCCRVCFRPLVFCAIFCGSFCVSRGRKQNEQLVPAKFKRTRLFLKTQHL